MIPSFRRTRGSRTIRIRASFVGVPESILVAGPPHRPLSSHSSNYRRRQNNDRFQLDALTFTVSPEQALEKFRRWASEEQGLTYIYSNVRISASFVPVWSFDLNVRFLSNHRLVPPPSFLREAYGDRSIIHLPGLSAYAGYSFRRALINQVHSTTLLFLGDKTVPFSSFMLRDMPLQGSSEKLQVFPDPWNCTRGHALSIVLKDLQSSLENESATVQSQVLKSRRVMMPTYVLDYTVLGIEYRAFVSGCDSGVSASGVSHQVMGGTSLTTDTFSATARRMAEGINASVRIGSPMVAVRVLQTVAQSFLGVGRVIIGTILRLPLLSGAASVGFAGFIAFRKILQPWWTQEYERRQWEAERQREAAMEDEFVHENDFVDSGEALRYFRANRGRILNQLRGEEARTEGNYDWYTDWEQWARQQWQQQQAQGRTSQQQRHDQQQQYYGQQQQQRQRQQQQQRTHRQQTKTKVEYEWDFDPNDPYSVLGIKPGATKAEISQAFRREMLRWHPDTQVNASQAERDRATERSKYITNAYRKLKSRG